MKCVNQYVFKPGMSQFICDTPEENQGRGRLCWKRPLYLNCLRSGSYDQAIVKCILCCVPKNSLIYKVCLSQIPRVGSVSAEPTAVQIVY